MKSLICILLVVATVVRSQWLPVYGAKNVIDPLNGEVYDWEYAVLPYIPNPDGHTYCYYKFKPPYAVKATDTCILRIYGLIPAGVDFSVTAQVDTSTYFILYPHTPILMDNQGPMPVDTVLTIRLPKYKYRDTLRAYTIIRHWSPRERFWMPDLLIDAVHLEFPVPDTSVRDTVIFDTTDIDPQDTIPLGVKVKYTKPNFTFDKMPAIDMIGRMGVDTTKSGVYFIRGRKKVVAE